MRALDRESAFFLLLGCVAAQRLVELVHSRRNLARLAREGTPELAESRADFARMVAVHVALVVLPALEVLAFGTRLPRALAWAAFGVFLAAQGLRFWTLATLGAYWNARAAVDPGRGFVAHGPYRFVRHPNYLAIALEFLSIPLVGGAWVSWIALNAANAWILARRIAGEDALLGRIPGYREAMGHKGALLPRLVSRRATAG